MAQITINEISNNYSFNIGDSSYCTVALPITACWGPAFGDLEATGQTLDDALENTTWMRFPANQSGLESFVATYRGASSIYRRAKDYSYQTALTLLTQGYDILVSRLCPGAIAQKSFTTSNTANSLLVKAKYAGTFGNNIIVSLKNINSKYWNAVVYAIDASGVKASLENLIFALELEHTSDHILHITEIESNYVTFTVVGAVDDATTFIGDATHSTTSIPAIILEGGSDTFAIPDPPEPPEEGEEPEEDTRIADMLAKAKAFAKDRFGLVTLTPENIEYVKDIDGTGEYITTPTTDINVAATIKYREWLFTYATKVFGLLEDKLTYNPNRLISPWDDQNFYELGVTEPVARFETVSPMHAKLMEVAYYGRCATAYLDIPKSLARSGVWNDSESSATEGYAQKLSRFIPATVATESDSGLFTTHAALFAPWGQYTYTGTSRQAPATPSFQALIIQRAMITNQANQYEWAMPTSRANSLKLGKLDYTVPQSLLDKWQSTEGTSLNIITAIPELGTSLWGNSTLYEVPPATYQALANLSTRLLINAIKDVVYKVGIGITYQYNNSEAYARFYAGVTPLLDTMSNVGALVKGKDVPGANYDDPGYTVTMAADINGLDSVNANSVIGTIQIRVAGIINNITVDLIALPQSASLN